jgi:hypothetical protein
MTKVVFLVCDKDETVLRREILPSGGAMVEALNEILAGNTVMISLWDDMLMHPEGYTFDIRQKRSMN